MSDSLLADLLRDLPEPDVTAAAEVAARGAANLRPGGAFARLEQTAAWLAGWQGTTEPRVERPRVIVFGADHGVTVEGVSAYPAAVTSLMVDALDREVATVSALARQVGAELDFVDVGVGAPTANIRTDDAMTPDEFDAAVEAGVDAVDRIDADLLVVGEIGIGNTTPAAAVTAAVLGGEPGHWAGPGTGVSGSSLDDKRNVVTDAVHRVGPVEPIEALRRLGGKELAAMAGATVAARRRRLPMLLDGFIATASVVPLERAGAGALDHCLAGHSSAEPGHARQLEAIDKEPLLRLDLRLGEGSGAVLAIPIVQSACAAVIDVATRAEFGIG